jgi:hypothetical protein
MAWFSFYYYLMGFDGTGPFVLSITRIVSKDIPFFMTFYLVVLIAFACSLSMLVNDGDPESSYGFYNLMVSFWVLIKLTVNFGEYSFGLDEDHVPMRLLWLFDFLQTFFYIIVVLMMLNLLIAMINSTYSEYMKSKFSLLLMEKYNIMCAMQRSMDGGERFDFRKRFAIEVPDYAIKIADDSSNTNDNSNNNNDRVGGSDGQNPKKRHSGNKKRRQTFHDGEIERYLASKQDQESVAGPVHGNDHGNEHENAELKKCYKRLAMEILDENKEWFLKPQKDVSG